jgi:hypothetical protein
VGHRAHAPTPLAELGRPEVVEHHATDEDRRVAVRVAYDAVNDMSYFIFKIDNKGTTFFVSQQPLQGIDEW